MADSDWARRWEDLGKTSFLKKTQKDHPEKWQNFYDQVCGLWEQMAGITTMSANIMAGALAGRGFFPEEGSVLEIGCGPGNLSVALATRGCRVTAMDHSSGMIGILKDKIRTTGCSGLLPLAADWNCLDVARNHDLVIAAFFPEACSPQGVSRMEKLAKQTCVLVLGNGASGFPFSRQIWQKVMEPPCPAAGNHLRCAQNFLKQAGRSPVILTLVLPMFLDVEARLARDYFRAYFGIFGCSRPLLDRAIDQVLEPHLKNGHLCFEGKSGAAMVCWPVPGDASL